MVDLAAIPAGSACQLDGQQRQALAVAALAGECISELSREHDVSRKFIYHQKDRAAQNGCRGTIHNISARAVEQACAIN